MIWDSHVYFAQEPAEGLVKIGHTGNPAVRFRRLRKDHPGLEILATGLGDHRAEDALHAMLIEDHVGHEWFRPSPKVMAAAIAVREGWIKPDELPRVLSPLRSAAAYRAHETRRRRLHQSDERPAA